MKIAKFINQSMYCYDENVARPQPSSKYVPKWYKDYHRYAKPNGEHGSLNDVKKGVAFPTFKNCVPFFDGLTAGYMYETPCDLRVYEKSGTPVIETEPGFEEFVGYRGPQDGLPTSDEFHIEHFYWLPPWAIKVPDGYSCLYISPMNRIDLPFYTIGGIIDNDKVSMTGQYPFMLKRGFTGIIPKGTPFAQIIPIKREDWKSEVEMMPPGALEINRTKTPFKYRRRMANYYRENDWTRKHYE